MNVGADFERAVERVLAARRARRLHVDEVVDADDLVLDLRCDRLLDDRSARADVRRLHLNERRRDRRKLRDGKHEDRDATQHDDHDGKHHRKDRACNEEVCHVLFRLYDDFHAGLDLLGPLDDDAIAGIETRLHDERLFILRAERYRAKHDFVLRRRRRPYRRPATS